MEAWSHHMLSTAQIKAKDIDQARANAVRAIRLFHQYGDVAGITLALDDFAAIAVAEDDLPRAARLWGAARALSSAGGVGLADFVDQQYDFYSRPNARSAIPAGGARAVRRGGPGDDARRERRVCAADVDRRAGAARPRRDGAVTERARAAGVASRPRLPIVMVDGRRPRRRRPTPAP